VLISVGITKNELNLIKLLPSKPLQRLTFALIVAAKHFNSLNEKNNGWVNLPPNEIFRKANVKTTISRQDDMYNDLFNRGLISLTQTGKSLNVKVEFICTDNPILVVTNFENISQFLEQKLESSPKSG